MSKRHYINNKEFTELLIAYNNDPDSKRGRKIYENIGSLLLMLANKVASGPSFNSYTPNIKEEMVQDAIFTMIKMMPTTHTPIRHSFYNNGVFPHIM